MKSRRFHATAFMGITIDGYIARSDGSVDYLPPAPQSSPDAGAQIHGSVGRPRVPTISEMLSSMDVIVLGRCTYETVLKMDWPYGDIPVMVLSTRPKASWQSGSDSGRVVEVVHSIEEACNYIQARGYGRVWVDGGKTVRSFLEAGWIDEMILTTVPVVLGKGISLFEGLKTQVNCEVVAVETIEGLIGVRYRVLNTHPEQDATLSEVSNQPSS